MKRAAFLFVAVCGCATTPAADGPRRVTMSEVQSIAACRTDPESTATREECDCIVQTVFDRSQEPGVFESLLVPVELAGDIAAEDAPPSMRREALEIGQEAARLNALTTLFGEATEACDVQP